MNRESRREGLIETQENITRCNFHFSSTTRDTVCFWLCTIPPTLSHPVITLGQLCYGALVCLTVDVCIY